MGSEDIVSGVNAADISVSGGGAAGAGVGGGDAAGAGVSGNDAGDRAMNTGFRRLVAVDVLRGLTIISMVAYHTCWDLVFMAGKKWEWYRGTGAFLWQQSICWTFILLAGFCTTLGRKTMKRGITVFLCGAVVSLATLFAMPEMPIIYGILTLHGSSMILVALLQRAGLLPEVSGGSERSAGSAGKNRALAVLAVCAAIFVVTYSVQRGFLGFFRKCIVPLPSWLYVNPVSSLTTFLGFMMPGFHSSDYFPLIPWFFLFLCGYFIGVLWKQRAAGVKQSPGTMQSAGARQPVGVKQSAAGATAGKSLPVRFLSFLGRHSLLIYMLHQPVIYGVVWLLFLR